jgi:hypothetical protein
VAFLGLAVWHDRVLRARERAAAAMAFYDHGLARIEDRWAGLGSTGDAFRDHRHTYEADLDLFGPASLFELLSIARTQSGEATLAGWLKTAADPDEIAARQQAVRELTPALDLREHLAASTASARRRNNSIPPDEMLRHHRRHAAGDAHSSSPARPRRSVHVGGAVGLRCRRAAGAAAFARRRRPARSLTPWLMLMAEGETFTAPRLPAAAAHRGPRWCSLGGAGRLARLVKMRLAA